MPGVWAIRYLLIFAGFSAVSFAQTKLIPLKCYVSIADRAAFHAFVNSDDDPVVPTQYQNHPALMELAFDPAHQKISRAALWEAFAVLQAEDCEEVVGPIVRGVPEVDFYDGYGHPVDVKAPFTNHLGEGWKLDIDRATQSILEKARKSYSNLWKKVPEKPTIILDVTRLAPHDLATLRRKLSEQATKEELSRIREVTIGFCP